MSLTGSFCEYLTSIKYSDLDKETIEAAKRIIIDFIGVAISGSKEESSKIWNEIFKDNSGDISVFGVEVKSGDLRKALALNAAYGHAQDLDDTHTRSITHPGVISIPIAMAMAEKYGYSGKDLILAIVRGVEAATRIGECINPSSYWYWHTTSVVGSFSAATAAASLLGFNADQLKGALGNAGTQASGLWQFMDSGSMSKTLHVVRANLNGLFSVLATQAGLTSADDILGGDKGFIRALAPEYHFEPLLDKQKDPFKINEVSIKAYPCCRHTHSAIDAVIELKNRYGLKPEDIEKIEDYTYEAAINTASNPQADSPYACKFSLEFLLAAGLADGKIDKDSFEDGGIRRVKETGLMGKVSVELSEDINRFYEEQKDRWKHRVVIRTKGGKSFEKDVTYPKGDAHNPLTYEELVTKFRSNTSGLVEKAYEDKLISYIQKLDHSDKIDFRF